MVNKSLSVSSTVVQTVEELCDALSALPPLVHGDKCGSRLLQMNATFFSYGGKVWSLPVTRVHKVRANTIQPRARRHQQQPVRAVAQSTRKGIL
jgi:hypothetical protein